MSKLLKNCTEIVELSNLSDENLVNIVGGISPRRVRRIRRRMIMREARQTRDGCRLAGDC